MATIELEHAIGYSGNVQTSLYYHPNGNDAVYVSGGSVVIADISDPHNQTFLRGHDDNISCLSMSKTGRLLASGQVGENSDVVVWDFETRKPLYRLSEHDHKIQDVAFSSDERLLASVGDEWDKKMFVWDMKSGNIVSSTAIAPDPTEHIVWCGREKDIKKRPTHRYVIAAAGAQQIRSWTLDPRTGEMTSEKYNSGSLVRDYTSLSVTDDEELLATGTSSGDFCLFHVRNRIMLHTINVCTGGIKSVLAAPNFIGSRTFFVGGGDGSITQLSEHSDEKYYDDRRCMTFGEVNALSFSPDGVELIAGTSKGYMYRVRIRDFKHVLHAENHSDCIVGVTYPPGVSDRFATVSHDGTMRIWDAGDYSVVAKVMCNERCRPTCIAFSGELVVTGWDDGRIRAYNADTGEFLWMIDNGHVAGVTAIAISNNQRFIISGGEEGEVRVWEVRTRELISHLKEHTLRVTCVLLFEDDMHALSCSRDRSLLAWDLRREKRLASMVQRMGAVYHAALSHDQTRVLSVGQEKKITYWDIQEMQAIKYISPAHREEAICIAMSHNGDIYATGGTDQVVKLWDFVTGNLLSNGVGHSGTVTSLAFSDDDRQLVSVGAEGNIFVWNVYKD
eukprot:GFYU01004401.1.p1 GENE.GFYU01004401.1~~GFYU01004401.1.p1  ORF type:complete len:617 (-),score=197.08 GFYU01004401.1:136-1986(-)